MKNCLHELREAIAAIESTPVAVAGVERSEPPDGDFHGLLDRPGVHEWFGSDVERELWIPPLTILLGLVRRRLDRSDGWAVWIGRRCRPYLRAIGNLDRSIFIDPPDGGGRLWAIDLATRCPAVAVVVTDGSGLDMAATRRLQLATESCATPVLSARPARERDHLSAATTRWLVQPVAAGTEPRWTVELLRCKGVQPDTKVLRTPGGSVRPNERPGVGRRWTVEWKRAQGGVDLSAALVDRPPAATGPHAEDTGERETVRRSA